MARIFLINIFMFLLPFLVYGAYLYFVRAGGKDTDYWRDAPVLWLCGIGIVFVIGALVSLVSFTGGGPDKTYLPPAVIDGVVVPGRVE